MRLSMSPTALNHHHKHPLIQYFYLIKWQKIVYYRLTKIKQVMTFMPLHQNAQYWKPGKYKWNPPKLDKRFMRGIIGSNNIWLCLMSQFWGLVCVFLLHKQQIIQELLIICLCLHLLSRHFSWGSLRLTAVSVSRLLGNVTGTFNCCGYQK